MKRDEIILSVELNSEQIKLQTHKVKSTAKK